MKFGIITSVFSLCALASLTTSIRLSAQQEDANQGHQRTFTPIIFPGSNGTSAWGINRRGDIAGIYYDTGYNAHGFLRRNGTFTEIHPVGATQTFVYGINDHDDVVGAYYDSSGTNGFLLHKRRDEGRDQGDAADLGAFTLINDPLAVGGTLPSGINRQGDIVGTYFDSSGKQHGFLLKRHECEGEDVEGLGTFTTIDVPGALRYISARDQL